MHVHRPRCIFLYLPLSVLGLVFHALAGDLMDRPQVISTDRHVMQGYLDLLRVEWDDQRHVLTGASKIVGDDPYTVSLALNGYSPQKVECKEKGIRTHLSAPKDGIVEFSLEGPENGIIEWSVSFGPE